MKDHTEIIDRWYPIVAAAGLYHPAMDANNLFMLAAAIMKDPIVLERVGAHMKTFQPTDEQLVCENVHEEVLNAMNPADKGELKKRIYALHSGKVQAK